MSEIIAEPRRRLLWFWLGVTMGGLSLTRENALVLIVVILLWALVGNAAASMGTGGWGLGVGGRELPRRVAAIGLFLIGLSIVLLPVARRNKVIGGELFVTTSQFGPNFYIGNNPQADGTYMSLRFGRGAPEYERQDATELAERARGRKLTSGEVSSYWTERAMTFITSQPTAWLKLVGRKIALLSNAAEMLDTESQATHAEWSTLLKLTGWIAHFGTLVPFALVGIVVAWPDRKRLWILYALPLAYARARQGNVEEAVSTLERALVIQPDYPDAHYNLANALMDRGQADAAIEHFRLALRTLPGSVETHNNLGIALAVKGQRNEAIGEFREALRLDSDSAKTYRNLGNALASVGARDDAIAHLRQAVERDPNDGSTHYDLATALLEKGAMQEAVDQFRAALRLMPSSVEAQNNLGIALGSQGRLDEAIDELRQALKVRPDFADAQRNLAMALQARKGTVSR